MCSISIGKRLCYESEQNTSNAAGQEQIRVAQYNADTCSYGRGRDVHKSGVLCLVDQQPASTRNQYIDAKYQVINIPAALMTSKAVKQHFMQRDCMFFACNFRITGTGRGPKTGNYGEQLTGFRAKHADKPFFHERLYCLFLQGGKGDGKARVEAHFSQGTTTACICAMVVVRPNLFQTPYALPGPAPCFTPT